MQANAMMGSLLQPVWTKGVIFPAKGYVAVFQKWHSVWLVPAPQTSTQKDYRVKDEVGTFLMMDMAHTSGLVAAASVLANPFEYCDIQDFALRDFYSLRGPRGGMIFFKKDSVHGVELESAINNVVFPGLREDEFVRFILVCDFDSGVDGARVEKILDMAYIILNKNSVPGETLIALLLVCIGDKSALVPGGIRTGAPAMTTREDLFVLSTEFPLVDEVSGLRRKVEVLTTRYPMPGV
ncbi:unnamed protein product [Sphenostylis stenocarpa]|uniref:Serine hydroxymethyltransferase-like domain-containing protein n=1 Tax=Sphenostylis stenocarpa TaxID=92480 RepID=A0AA86VE96_9FABA|nr:unnamed protein product [Sphenostylis stenocarpa]